MPPASPAYIMHNRDSLSRRKNCKVIDDERELIAKCLCIGVVLGSSNIQN